MKPLRWRDQRPGEWVLRLWLGVTFLYAGVHKLADPDFFDAASPTYIGAQLRGFAEISPIGGLLRFLADDLPVAAGVGVALTEILVGVATLAGIAPALTALAGFGLSVTLWLSATWQVEPYFLGSDSIYAVAWLAYALCLPSTLAVLAWVRRRDPDRAGALAPDDARRATLRAGALVAAALAVAGAAGLIRRGRDSSTAASPSPAPTPNPPAPPAGSATTTAPAGTGAVIATVADVEQAGGVEFDDPEAGASVVCALSGGGVAAFSRRCTHQGCVTNFDAATRRIVCPCHGSQFDPAAGGAPLTGPATRPLPSVPVRVDGDVVRRA